jgi:hypothetical protein
MAADCVLIHRDDYMAIMHLMKEEGERHLGVPGDDIQRNYFANSGRSRTAAKATAFYVADVMNRVLQESPNQVCSQSAATRAMLMNFIQMKPRAWPARGNR